MYLSFTTKDPSYYTLREKIRRKEEEKKKKRRRKIRSPVRSTGTHASL